MRVLTGREARVFLRLPVYEIVSVASGGVEKGKGWR
jgi:hypothetical protein